MQSMQMEVIVPHRSGHHLATYKNHLGRFRIITNFKWITTSLSQTEPIHLASPESRHFGILVLQIHQTHSWHHKLAHPTFSAQAISRCIMLLSIRSRSERTTSCFLLRRHTIQQMNHSEATIQAPLGLAQASKWNILSPTSNLQGLQLQ